MYPDEQKYAKNDAHYSYDIGPGTALYEKRFYKKCRCYGTMTHKQSNQGLKYERNSYLPPAMPILQTLVGFLIKSPQWCRVSHIKDQKQTHKKEGHGPGNGEYLVEQLR